MYKSIINLNSYINGVHEVGHYIATNCACMSPAVQGRGLCQPPGGLPALQLVGEPSCPPQTSLEARSQVDKELVAAERMLAGRRPGGA